MPGGQLSQNVQVSVVVDAVAELGAVAPEFEKYPTGTVGPAAVYKGAVSTMKPKRYIVPALRVTGEVSGTVLMPTVTPVTCGPVATKVRVDPDTE